MARLAFFTEQLPNSSTVSSEINEFSYGLMVTLADQQHDVRVFSTYREGDELPRTHARLQIIRPFRKWSWLEIPRLVPILLDFQPEILHFIQPRKEVFSGLTNATSVIPAMAPLIGRPRILVSLYDVRATELQKNRLLLSSADIVIVANKEQADAVAAWFDRQKKNIQVERAQIEIVSLPTQSESSTLEIEVLPALESLNAQTLIFVPGDLDEQREPQALAENLNSILNAVPGSGVIFGGGWGALTSIERRNFMREFEDRGNGARVLLTGPLSQAGENACLTVASLVLLAGRPATSLSLARLIRQALQAGRPLVLSDEQQRLDPMKWRDRENSFIVDSNPHQWGRVLSEALLDEKLIDDVRSRLPDFARTEAVDEPSNAMSRIYAQVLRSPRKSTAR